MSPSAPASEFDNYLIVDDTDDDITQILVVACERPITRWTASMTDFDGGAA